MEWFQIFREWITYPVVAVCSSLSAWLNGLIERGQVLLGTGIGQIRYLNRALMRFDSKVKSEISPPSF